MIFYHGTTQDAWKQIQQEGILFGRLIVIDNETQRRSSKYNPSRCTYLTPMIEEAKCYGDVLLQVEYDPYRHPKKNNYIEDCWQFRVYEPIPLTKVKRIEL